MTRSPGVLAVALLMAVSGCECEDRVRKAVSNSGDRTRPKDPQKPISSDPRELEPNDGRADASPIALDTELRAVLGSIDTGEDVDWFRFTLSGATAALLEVSVEPKSERCDPEVFLGQPGSDESSSYDVSKPGEPEVIPVVSLTDIALELGVRGKQCAGTEYAIRFKRRLSGGALEAEPNDALAAAWPFSAPGELQGFYDRPNDRDVMRVAVPGDADAVYTLRLNGMERITQTMEVFSSPSATEHDLALFAPAGRGAEIPNLRLSEGVQELWVAIGATESQYSRDAAWRLQWLHHPPVPAHLQHEGAPHAPDTTPQPL